MNTELLIALITFGLNVSGFVAGSIMIHRCAEDRHPVWYSFFWVMSTACAGYALYCGTLAVKIIIS